jgi:hypothetical protein
MTDHRTFCVVGRRVLAGDPVVEILSFEPVDPSDAGFVCFAAADAREPDVDALETLCLHCLIELHPEAGRGLDEARRTGNWVAS